MEVKTISYKRVLNLGNYNNEHLEMMAELSPGDDPEQCTAELKAKVEAALGINKPGPPQEPKPKPQPVAAAASKNFDDEPF